MTAIDKIVSTRGTLSIDVSRGSFDDALMVIVRHQYDFQTKKGAGHANHRIPLSKEDAGWLVNELTRIFGGGA